jgi:cytochrome c553
MKKLIIALAACVVSFNASAGGNVANGEALAKKYNCAACHGADYTKAIDPSYPTLAGQHYDYLAHALKRNNPIMAGQVKPLSDKDIADIAAYLSSLPSSLVTHR